jgi:hypothetical protein
MNLPIGKFILPSPIYIICGENKMKTPCEIIVWSVVPIIRKEFAKKLIENHDLTQRAVANKLGITEAAVSRYVSGKRGALEITDDEILEEIKESAKRIVKENGTTVIEETCRICRILKSREFIDGINYACE